MRNQLRVSFLKNSGASMSRTPGRVAQEGYDGLIRGRRVVIPGTNNKLAALLARLLPRRLVLWLMRVVARPELS